MQIAEELFIDARDALGLQGLPESRPITDKRRHLRVNADAEVTIEPYGAVTALPRRVRLLDISRSGICILDQRPMKTTEPFLLHLPRSGRIPLPVMCLVRNCRMRSGRFRVGAEFAARAEYDAARVLLCGINGIRISRHDGDPGRSQITQRLLPQDRRREPRVDRCTAIRLMSYSNGETGPVELAHMRDCSDSGICIASRLSMEPGAQFISQPAGARNDPAWGIYRVTNVGRLNDGTFRIGASLTGRRSLPDPRGLLIRVRHWLTRVTEDVDEDEPADAAAITRPCSPVSREAAG